MHCDVAAFQTKHHHFAEWVTFYLTSPDKAAAIARLDGLEKAFKTLKQAGVTAIQHDANVRVMLADAVNTMRECRAAELVFAPPPPPPSSSDDRAAQLRAERKRKREAAARRREEEARQREAEARLREAEARHWEKFNALVEQLYEQMDSLERLIGDPSEWCIYDPKTDGFFDDRGVTRACQRMLGIAESLRAYDDASLHAVLHPALKAATDLANSVHRAHAEARTEYHRITRFNHSHGEIVLDFLMLASWIWPEFRNALLLMLLLVASSFAAVYLATKIKTTFSWPSGL